MNFNPIGSVAQTMHNHIKFETPENIEVSYRLAGAGTRFLAWFTDNILVTILAIGLLFLLLCAGIASDSVIRELFEPLEEIENPENVRQMQLLFLGIWLIVWGLGGFVYFGLSELFLRGQTLGKRMTKIRVAKVDGFSLDPLSIFIRNIFRVADQLPPLWIVPVVSAKSQRLGDMVAGTIVIVDDLEPVGTLRAGLENRSAAESRFRFDASMLKRAGPQNFQAIERILERWHDLSPDDRRNLTEQIVPVLARRLKGEVPAAEDYHRFLEDLLAAEYRRQQRSLG